MKKIVIAVMSTVSAVVLVFSFDASRRDATVVTAAREPAGGSDEAAIPSADPTDDPTADPAADDATDDATDEPVDDPSAEPAPATSSERAGNVSGTFTGDAAQTRWGPVQVRIVVKNGRIVKATAIEFPQANHHDIEINSWAIPQLEQATVDSNGRNIDSYSGATVTCDGYRASLQSALDQANR